MARTFDMNLYSVRIGLAAGLLAITANLPAPIRAQQPTATSMVQADTAIPAPALLRTTDLVQLLHASEKPLVLQVGSHVLYAEAHVPGAEYIGATGTSAGLQALRERVSALKKDQLIVIYCGCCPWGRCPNIRPAYQQLQSLGFTHVKALYLPENFGTDWVDKGYPTTKGR